MIIGAEGSSTAHPLVDETKVDTLVRMGGMQNIKKAERILLDAEPEYRIRGRGNIAAYCATQGISLQNNQHDMNQAIICKSTIRRSKNGIFHRSKVPCNQLCADLKGSVFPRHIRTIHLGVPRETKKPGK